MLQAKASWSAPPCEAFEGRLGRRVHPSIPLSIVYPSSYPLSALSPKGPSVLFYPPMIPVHPFNAPGGCLPETAAPSQPFSAPPLQPPTLTHGQPTAESAPAQDIQWTLVSCVRTPCQKQNRHTTGRGYSAIILAGSTSVLQPPSLPHPTTSTKPHSSVALT